MFFDNSDRRTSRFALASSLIIPNLDSQSLVMLAFCGWGDTELPQSLDDVVNWFKNFEIDHGKVPDWIYALVDRLLKYRDQCETFSVRYRAFHFSARALLGADTYLKLCNHGSSGSPLRLYLQISLPLAIP